MWLLNTARAELKFFPTPESIPGGYAILSHVWDEHEQTFQDLQALRIRCAADGTNPRDLVCDKVRNFCVLAERGGHGWGWADMCCIDKTSSTELSEAIVSMYRYYSLADICYAYLRDVPTASEDDLRAPESAFRKSRWHQRGWTLQELIAPSMILFISSSWELLYAKADLADLLEEITRVPAAVLKLHDKPSAYCVAARMSWAADRETTRPEDEAYCLMGIFGIFMPPIYGEGRNAFLRLQEEIIRQIDDPSISAWERRDPMELASLDDNSLVLALLNTCVFDWGQPGGFFASSPSDFRIGHNIKLRTEYTPSRSRPSFWEKFKRVSPRNPGCPRYVWLNSSKVECPQHKSPNVKYNLLRRHGLPPSIHNQDGEEDCLGGPSVGYRVCIPGPCAVEPRTATPRNNCNLPRPRQTVVCDIFWPISTSSEPSLQAALESFENSSGPWSKGGVEDDSYSTLRVQDT